MSVTQLKKMKDVTCTIRLLMATAQCYHEVFFKTQLPRFKIKLSKLGRVPFGWIINEVSRLLISTTVFNFRFASTYRHSFKEFDFRTVTTR